MLDSVTFGRYQVGTITNCESPEAGGGLVPGEGPVKQMLRRPFAVPGCFAGSGGRAMATAKAKKTTLMVRGGALPKRVPGRPSDWTRKMSDQFVEMLAETCNVTLAAASIGRSIGNVYKWRGKDAAFRAAWDRALAVGYSRLELMLLERALHGVEKVVVARDGTSSVMREYPDRVALTLLRMHRETAAMAEEIVDGREHDEACARIIAKLSRLKDRDAKEAHGELETKEAAPRLAYIRSALLRCAVIRRGHKARAR